ncbi:hypothetical protein AAH043_20270 [Bacteroides nordii]|uniref:hypothetical protein n=1 Tax=Bacteroides nordii TaxID=291645 RepID=UPI0039B39B4A
MEELKINKATVIDCFKNASDETKDALKHLFGEKVFEFDYTSIRTFEDACRKRGISSVVPGVTTRDDYDKKAMLSSLALYQLLIIQDAINDGQPLDEDGDAWYPYWILYSKEEIAEMGEDKRKANGIALLSCVSANASEYAGVRGASAYSRGANTLTYFGFPLCFGSKEKALYAGKQFESLYLQYYGLKLQEGEK